MLFYPKPDKKSSLLRDFQPRSDIARAAAALKRAPLPSAALGPGLSAHRRAGRARRTAARCAPAGMAHLWAASQRIGGRRVHEPRPSIFAEFRPPSDCPGFQAV